MTYQTLHELELKYKLDSLHRDAERRSQASLATEQDFARDRIRQIQLFAGVLVLFMLALAASSVAIVLHEIGPWVFGALAIWAASLVVRATTILAPELQPEPAGLQGGY
jgi:fatty acid desaturase